MRYIFAFATCFTLITMGGWGANLKNEAHANGLSWVTDGTYAGVTIELKDTPRPNTKANLLVSFPRNQECQPEIAVLVNYKYDIGELVARQITRKNMYITVGDKQIYSNAIVTKYTNGLEFGFFSSEEQISIFSSGNYAVVTCLEGWKPFLFPLNNAQRAINKARTNCLFK